MPEPPADELVELAAEERDGALVQRRRIDDDQRDKTERDYSGAAEPLPARALRFLLNDKAADAKAAIRCIAGGFVSLRRTASHAPIRHRPPRVEQATLLAEREDVDRVAARGHIRFGRHAD